MSIRFIAIGVSLLIAVVVFVLDWLFVPAEIIVAIPYVAAVMVSLVSTKQTDTVAVAALCIILTIVGWLLSIDEQPDGHGFPAINRGLVLLVIVLITFVGVSRKRLTLRLVGISQQLNAQADDNAKRAELHAQELTRVTSVLGQESLQRQKVEEQFREQISRYRSLVEALPLNVFQKDRDGRLLFGNSRYFQTLGKTPAEALGKTDAELFPAELAAKYQQDDLQVLSEGKPMEKIEEHILPSGEKLYVQVFKAPIVDDADRVVGCQGMFWDVTARVLAEQAQHESDSRFRRLVRSNIMGVIWAKFDGQILDANKSFLNLLGYTIDDVTAGKLRLDKLTPPEFAEVDQQIREITLRDSFCQPLEKEFFHRDGNRVPVLVGAAHLENDQFIGFILDISERKRSELELKDAKEQALSANRTKSLFLANVSHELRTPLNAIIGMSEVVLKSPLKREQSEFLKSVLNAGESLLDIINDVLEFSTLDVGKIKLDPAPFAPREMLAQSIKSLSISVGGKGLELGLEIANDIPEVLIGDSKRIRQVVKHLIGNSIKFTERGGIQVTASAAQRRDDDLVLHCSIADTGIGISESSQASIFEAFEKADNSSTRNYGGTGLGLAICKSLVELMDGKIWLESEVGQGSTFHFTVHLKVAQGEQQTTVSGSRQEAAILLPPMRILLAEDSIVNQQLIKGILNNQNQQLTIVNNGKQAVAAYRSDPAFDAILMDIQMPEMDGLEATRQIRELEKQSGARVPIVAVTAHALPEDRQRCKQADMDDFLAKPIHFQQLIDLLARIAQDRGIMTEASLSQQSTQSQQSESAAAANESAVGDQDNRLSASGHVDWQRAVSAVNGDKNLLAHLIEAFAEETPTLLTAIRAAIDAGDIKKMQHNAHTLKGSMRLFAADRGYELAYALENPGDQINPETEATFCDLEKEVAGVLAELAAFGK